MVCNHIWHLPSLRSLVYDSRECDSSYLGGINISHAYLGTKKTTKNEIIIAKCHRQRNIKFRPDTIPLILEDYNGKKKESGLPVFGTHESMFEALRRTYHIRLHCHRDHSEKGSNSWLYANTQRARPMGLRWPILSVSLCDSVQVNITPNQNRNCIKGFRISSD